MSGRHAPCGQRPQVAVAGGEFKHDPWTGTTAHGLLAGGSMVRLAGDGRESGGLGCRIRAHGGGWGWGMWTKYSRRRRRAAAGKMIKGGWWCRGSMGWGSGKME